MRDKGLFVEEIRKLQGGEGKGIFLVSRRELSSTRSGSPFMRLVLKDRTGEVEAVLWELGDEHEGVAEGSLVEVFFEKRVYRDKDQLRVVAIENIDPSEVDSSWFVRTSRKSIEWMKEKLFWFVESVENPYLRKLLELVFTDPEVEGAFFNAPASSRFHHSFVGGLLEHTLSVTIILDFIARHYRGLDRDVLITAGLLHDVGKIWEIKQDMEGGYTDRGMLLGHIYMGASFVERVIQRIDGFPEGLKDVILHVIISHHGEYEFGSPKRPKTLEALVLHFVDNMDAKFEGVRSRLDEIGEDDVWTERLHMMGRRFYLYKDSKDNKYT